MAPVGVGISFDPQIKGFLKGPYKNITFHFHKNILLDPPLTLHKWSCSTPHSTNVELYIMVYQNIFSRVRCVHWNILIIIIYYVSLLNLYLPHRYNMDTAYQTNLISNTRPARSRPTTPRRAERSRRRLLGNLFRNYAPTRNPTMLNAHSIPVI